jgi:hypothetical protein
MGKKTLKLYVNDPMGKRCEMNMQAAERLRDELGLDLVVIKKTSEEYAKTKEQPPCPSVAVDDRYVVQNGTIGYDELKAEVLKD